MPQCPICNAAVWVGQQYCSTCDNPLPQSEKEGFVCPQCGTPLAHQQETCRQCPSPPPEIAEVAKAPLMNLSSNRRFRFRGSSIFLGAGLIIAALFLVFFFRDGSKPPQVSTAPSSAVALRQAPPATSAAPAIPATPAATATAATVSSIRASSTTSSPPPVAEVPEPSPPAATTPPPSQEEIPAAKRPKYFVTIQELSVREGPDTSTPRIAILKLKAEVELLETSGGWGKVRDLERQIVGWSYMRYLQPLATDPPQGVSRQRPVSAVEPETVSAEDPQQM